MEDLHWETVQIDDCTPNEMQIDLFLLANGEEKCFVQQYGKVLPDPEKFQQLFRDGTLRVKLKEDPWAKKPKKSRRWPWRRKEEPRRPDYRKKRLRKS